MHVCYDSDSIQRCNFAIQFLLWKFQFKAVLDTRCKQYLGAGNEGKLFHFLVLVSRTNERAIGGAVHWVPCCPETMYTYLLPSLVTPK